MNQIVGKSGAAITGFAVLAFAISMIVALFVKGTFSSCFSSIFIAIGFVPFIGAIFAADSNADHKAIGFVGMMFASIVKNNLLYFAIIRGKKMSNPIS